MRLVILMLLGALADEHVAVTRLGELPPPRYLFAMHSRPTILRGVCLRRDRACVAGAGTTVDLAELRAALNGSALGTIERALGADADDADAEIVYYDAERPLVRARGADARAPRVERVANASLDELLRRAAPAAGGGAAATAATCGHVAGGANGATAAAHYDASHNLFAQLHGAKRLWLAS